MGRSSDGTFCIYNARGIKIIDSNLTAPTTGTNTLTLYNAEVIVTNSAANTNLVTIGGLGSPSNSVLSFFNGKAAITDTNVDGARPITLGGSTLTFNQGAASFSNNLNVVAASTLAFASGSNTFSGVPSGSGPLTINLPANSLLTVQSNWSGFVGTMAITNSGMLRFNQAANSWGDSNATFDAGSSGTINNRSTNNITIFLGALTGGSGSKLRGSDQAGPGVDTYVIGGLNSNTTFAGTITDGTSSTTPHTVALTKMGNGTFTLSGTNSYSGGTTVSNGTLLVNNSNGSATGTGAVTVVNAATLGGSGVIGGPVTVNGTLAPGNGTGTLTISNSLAVNGGAVLQYSLGTTGDLTVVSGDLTLGGTLNVTDAGGFTNMTYTLFSYGGSLAYNGLAVGTTPNTNFTYTDQRGGSGEPDRVRRRWWNTARGRFHCQPDEWPLSVDGDLHRCLDRYDQQLVLGFRGRQPDQFCRFNQPGAHVRDRRVHRNSDRERFRRSQYQCSVEPDHGIGSVCGVAVAVLQLYQLPAGRT